MMETVIYILIVLAAALLFVMIVSAYENRHFVVRRYTVAGDKLPPAFDGYRIAVISDLHNQEFGRENERLLAAIREQSPDIAICAGDILVGKPGADFTTAASLVRSLVREYPVYLAMGNHEYRMKIYPDVYGDMWERYYAETSKTDSRHEAVWLDNETAYIVRDSEKIAITGLSIDRMYYKRFQKHEMPAEYVERLCPFSDRSVFQILLAHNPDYFPAYAAYGADLVISGHVHGGMVRLPLLGGMISPRLRLFPKYDRGEFTIGKSTMLLHAGLGNHTIRFRVNNRPELMIVTLKRTG